MNAINLIDISARYKKDTALKPSHVIRFCEEENIYNLYQSMLQELLAIDGYSEVVVALGADIPLNIIHNIHNGIMQNPSVDILGKMLRFYNRVIYGRLHAPA